MDWTDRSWFWFGSVRWIGPKNDWTEIELGEWKEPVGSLWTRRFNYIYIYKCVCVWNQGLVNLGFDDNKIRFRTNDYISSVIRQDDFQGSNHKDKLSQWEIMKKKTTSVRRVFLNPNVIRSLCKIIGALGLSCISFFIYAPKSSKSNIVFVKPRFG